MSASKKEPGRGGGLVLPKTQKKDVGAKDKSGKDEKAGASSSSSDTSKRSSTYSSSKPSSTKFDGKEERYGG